MVTVSSIIKSALRKLRVIDPGETPSAAEMQDAKEVFTQMVDSWSNEQLLIPIINEVTHTLEAGVTDYTIGIYPTAPIPTTHIETPLPDEWKTAFIRSGDGTDYPQENIDVSSYARISRKSNESRPSRFYVQKGWPISKISFESAPYEAEVLHLYVVQPLVAILPTANLTDVINLPPGYERALIFNLCLDLADEFGKDISQAIAIMATDAKRKIKNKNYSDVVLSVDNGIISSKKSSGTYVIDQGP